MLSISHFLQGMFTSLGDPKSDQEGNNSTLRKNIDDSVNKQT